MALAPHKVNKPTDLLHIITISRTLISEMLLKASRYQGLLGWQVTLPPDYCPMMYVHKTVVLLLRRPLRECVHSSSHQFKLVGELS